MGFAGKPEGPLAQHRTLLQAHGGVPEPAALGRSWEETQRLEEAVRGLVLASLLERKAGGETSGLCRP